MDDSKRKALWEAYFEANFRHRYFLMLKDRLQTRIKWLSVSIALLSLGPLVSYFWQLGWGDLIALSGIAAGACGVYLAVSNLARALAVAIQAATVWGQAAGRLQALWVRCEGGESVWTEFEALERDLAQIDAVATEHLADNSSLVEGAWTKTTQALAYDGMQSAAMT